MFLYSVPGNGTIGTGSSTCERCTLEIALAVGFSCLGVLVIVFTSVCVVSIRLLMNKKRYENQILFNIIIYDGFVFLRTVVLL